MNEQKKSYQLSEIERLRLLYRIYVEHPDAKKIISNIERCHQSREISPEPRSMTLTGSTGSGKSTLIEQYMRQHPPTEKDKTSIVPIFKSVIPANTTPPDFIISVLRSLIASVNNCESDEVPEQMLSGKPEIIKERLYAYVRKAGVKLIILDEFQHLISSKNHKVLTQLAATIKTMIIEAKVPIIMVGTSRAKAVFEVDKEVARRFHSPMEVSPFKIDTQESTRTFRKFLAEIDKLLPFKELSNLAAHDLAIRFYAASNGFIDDIMRILRDAGYTSIMEDSPKILLKHLASAFDSNSGKNHTAPGNPFTTPIEKIESWKCINDALKGKVTSAESIREAPVVISDVF